MARLDDEPLRIILDAVDLDRLLERPLWIEYECDTHDLPHAPMDRLLREGWLVMREDGIITGYRYGERRGSYEADYVRWHIVRRMAVGLEVTYE